jgi:hypothetical protein
MVRSFCGKSRPIAATSVVDGIVGGRSASKRERVGVLLREPVCRVPAHDKADRIRLYRRS